MLPLKIKRSQIENESATLRGTHPEGEIMDYLHAHLCVGNMNEEHLAAGRTAPAKQTQGLLKNQG